jgi:formyltetrahydrofolate deformylase
VNFAAQRPAVAIFVSRQDHCLLDLLWRTRTGELPMQVPLVIANHPDLGPIVEEFGACFAHVPISAENRDEAEARHLELLVEHGIELVILAKYMQVLTPGFLAAFDPPDAFHQVINIHHSFLPAFKGAQPYHRAWERGVKLIGATAHYVTEELDGGPIIAQSTVGVGHRDEVDDLIRKGRDTERLALARAVRLHLKRQVMVYRGRLGFQRDSSRASLRCFARVAVGRGPSRWAQGSTRSVFQVEWITSSQAGGASGAERLSSTAAR